MYTNNTMEYIDEELFESELIQHIHEVTYHFCEKQYIQSPMINIKREIENYFLKRKNKKIADFKVELNKDGMSYTYKLHVVFRYMGQYQFKHISVSISPDSFVAPPDNYNHNLLKDCILLRD